MRHVVIIGTATWGTTLGIILSRNKIPVCLLARTKKEMLQLQKDGENKRFLPSFMFPPLLTINYKIEDSLRLAKAIILAVPSRTMRENIKNISPWITENLLIISASKGLEFPEGKTMSQVLEEILPLGTANRISVLSGPNLAKEIAAGQPSSAVIASHNLGTCRKAQSLLTTPTFRIYTNEDVLGTELGGSLKNIMAIGAGICDGLGYGDNAKAAFMTRGLTEISNLGSALGAKSSTFTGLSGMGDLITTCSSNLSRNRHIGVQLAKGLSLDTILKQMDNVAEGTHTTAATLAIAKKHNVEMPITQVTHAILSGKLTAQEAATRLMGRCLKAE